MTNAVKRPSLCFQSIPNAIAAAIMCTNREENNAHINILYHISERKNTSINANLSKKIRQFCYKNLRVKKKLLAKINIFSPTYKRKIQLSQIWIL